MREYVVKPGDSLWKIAKKESTSVDTLAHLNGLKGRSVHLLRVGQKLKLPASGNGDPDSLLTLMFRGLDFSFFTPHQIKVEHDGKTQIHALTSDNTLPLSVYDRSLGLKVWIEDLERNMVQTLNCALLPVGKWNVAIDSRKVRLKGNLMHEEGAAETTTNRARKQTAAGTQQADGNTTQQQTRVEGGQPLHVVATIYTEANLRLASGNEKYRAMIIDTALKYALTPQSIAALIGAEAAADKDGTWRADSNEQHPHKAQGLAQFFPHAWTDVFNYPPSLLCQDCKSLREAEWMKKRLEAKYAIDGAGAYATLNLHNFARATGYDVDSLAPEDKAKLGYLLHHEGLTGARRLLQGKPKSYTVEQAIRRLTGQVGSAIKASQLVAQHHGDSVEAYKSWLFSFIDAKIHVNHFTVHDPENSLDVSRSMADIVASLTNETPVQKPTQRQAATAAPANKIRLWTALRPFPRL